MPKIVDTRRHCKVGLKECSKRDVAIGLWKIVACSPCSAFYNFWHGIIPTSCYDLSVCNQGSSTSENLCVNYNLCTNRFSSGWVEEDGENRGFDQFLSRTLAVYSSYFVSVVGHDQMTKSSTFGRVQAFPLHGSLGMSTPSLHRESTDSLIA